MPYLLFRVLPAFSVLALALGLSWRLRRWLALAGPFACTPAGLRALGRRWEQSAAEAILGPELRRAHPWVWAARSACQLSLVVLGLGHLRYCLYPVPGAVVALQGAGVGAGCILVAALGSLLAARLLGPEPPLKRCGAPGLVAALAVTGLAMRLALPPDVVEVKAMCLGLLSLAPDQMVPASPVFAAHFLLANAALIYLPWRGLVRAPAAALEAAGVEGGTVYGAPGWALPEGGAPASIASPLAAQAPNERRVAA